MAAEAVASHETAVGYCYDSFYNKGYPAPSFDEIVDPEARPATSKCDVKRFEKEMKNRRLDRRTDDLTPARTLQLASNCSDLEVAPFSSLSDPHALCCTANPHQDEENLGRLGLHRKLWKIALPAVSTYACNVAVNSVSIFALGRKGNAELQAGYALGLSIGGVMVQAIGFGLATGLDALCPQAVGRQKKGLCWWYLLLCVLVLTVASIPLCCGVWFCRPILMSLGQDPAVATHAQSFLRWSILGLYASYLFESLQKFCIFLGHTRPPVWAALAEFPVHCLALYLLLEVASVNACLAAGLARSVSLTFRTSIVIAFVYRNREKMGWNSRSSGVEQSFSPSFLAALGHNGGRYLFDELMMYCYIALPSALMLCGEWIALEFQVLQSSFFGPVELAAFSITDYVNSLLFVVPLGLSIALSSCVGNQIGAGCFAGARRYLLICVESAVVYSLACFFLLAVARSSIATLASTNGAVRDALTRDLRWLPILTLPDCAQATLAGVVKGLGLQSRIFVAAILSLFVVMQVSGAALSHLCHLSGRGLIVGGAIGLSTAAWYYWSVLIVTDWSACVDECKERTEIDVQSLLEVDRLPPLSSSTDSLPVCAERTKHLPSWYDSYKDCDTPATYSNADLSTALPSTPASSVQSANNFC